MQRITQPVRHVIVGTFLMGLLAGCASMSESEQDTTKRTLTGAAVGIAAGAIIDDGGLGGVAAGAAVGAATGWLYDRHKKKQDEGN